MMAKVMYIQKTIAAIYSMSVAATLANSEHYQLCWINHCKSDTLPPSYMSWQAQCSNWLNQTKCYSMVKLPCDNYWIAV